MTIVETVILAIIQAVTEFIPVSSSGHLLAIEELTSIKENLGLDIILHGGTLLALIIFYRSTLADFYSQALKGKTSRLLTSLAIATVPAALAGALFDDFFSDSVRSLPVVITMLTIVGIVMIYADKLFNKAKKQSADKLKNTSAWWIGLAQVLALIPGTSRSGITILAGRWQGMDNRNSANFAFLLGIPIILGATVKTLAEKETRDYIASNQIEVWLGIATAALIGWLVLKFLIDFVARKGLRLFGYYRLSLAALLTLIMII